MTAAATSPYKIDLPQFTGPLDLLLHLIDHEELDITSISLAAVTGQYLAQIERMRQDRMESLIDFIVVGARLLLIKSRALLPAPPALPGEDEDEEDPAEALVRLLRRYRRFKEAAQWLGRREEQGLRSYLRVSVPRRVQPKLDLSGVTTEALLEAMHTVLARAEVLEESVNLVRPRQITIDDQIKRLRSSTRAGGRLPFTQLLSRSPSRQEVAVTLLAVLELVKRHEISAVQETMFGPIEIVGRSGRS